MPFHTISMAEPIVAGATSAFIDSRKERTLANSGIIGKKNAWGHRFSTRITKKILIDLSRDVGYAVMMAGCAAEPDRFHA